MTASEWTWTRETSGPDGRLAEWRGQSRYHSATVARYLTGWQATIPAGDSYQRSGYYASAASAKAWCGRYGQPRTTRTHARRKARS